jgi:hypothetical protein
MKSKIWIFVFVLSLAMNIGVATIFGLRFVQTKGAGVTRECPFSSNDTYLFTLLGLSQEQLVLVTPLAHNFHEEIDKLSNDVQEKRNIMISMLEQDSFDREHVDLTIKELLSIQSAIQQLVFEHILEMKQMLRPEQRKVFFEALRQSFIAQNLNCNEQPAREAGRQ